MKNLLGCALMLVVLESFSSSYFVLNLELFFYADDVAVKGETKKQFSDLASASENNCAQNGVKVVVIELLNDRSFDEKSQSRVSNIKNELTYFGFDANSIYAPLPMTPRVTSEEGKKKNENERFNIQLVCTIK